MKTEGGFAGTVVLTLCSLEPRTADWDTLRGRGGQAGQRRTQSLRFDVTLPKQLARQLLTCCCRVMSLRLMALFLIYILFTNNASRCGSMMTACLSSALVTQVSVDRF